MREEGKVEGLKVVYRHDSRGELLLYISAFPESWPLEKQSEFFNLFLDTIDDQVLEHPLGPEKVEGSLFAALKSHKKR